MSDVKYWIVVVDDDVANLMMAGNVMSKNGMRVTALKSGKALLEYIETKEVPDLCLLDIKMPDMNGFETLKALRASERGKDLPVVFLTADESQMAETKGLSLGAMDFIKKPFVPEVLVLRARHIIDLVRLQKNLAHEVAVKTEENHKIFVHVVSALAAAIDAKDIYTGHSERVAKYAKAIAERYGYNEQKRNEIYMMGLLHDVGKIGVPDAILQKPDSLTDEEAERIHEHTVIGAQILASIKEVPSLALAAKYHHERYDGTGYPDGLSGEKIPEQARIIAVADSYDAMISRDQLSQDDIRDKIAKGSGTQFDPKFAEIMLKMIDEGVV
jgi:putative nucleotidyltransferase with HDIG domain